MNKCNDCTHFLKDCGFSKADKLLGFDGECVACGQFVNKRIHEHNYDNCHNLTCKRKSFADGYNQAIDDFAERLTYKIKSEIDDCADELDWIEALMKQMKK